MLVRKILKSRLHCEADCACVKKFILLDQGLLLPLLAFYQHLWLCLSYFYLQLRRFCLKEGIDNKR